MRTRVSSSLKYPFGLDGYKGAIWTDMGEAKQKLSATAKLIQQFPACAFCGGIRATSTREHMPPKALFDNSLRPDRLVMPACSECNRGTSTSDLVVAMISRWDFYANNQSLIDHS
jgi:hypothetical protein